MSTLKINLWSGPRNVSTAMMYSFAQRPDTKVLDEPLYAFYLSSTKAKAYHPESSAIIEAMESNGSAVIEDIEKDESAPVLFLKHMTHHLLDLNNCLLSNSKNILLTRKPKEAIHSFAKVIPRPSINDLGYIEQWELLQRIKDLKADYWITDRTNILRDPEKELKKICTWAGIPFYTNMLHWPLGPKPYDGIWADYWYANVHQSTGFLPYEEKYIELSSELRPLEKACEVYYKKIMNERKGQQ